VPFGPLTASYTPFAAIAPLTNGAALAAIATKAGKKASGCPVTGLVVSLPPGIKDAIP